MVIVLQSWHIEGFVALMDLHLGGRNIHATLTNTLTIIVDVNLLICF